MKAGRPGLPEPPAAGACCCWGLYPGTNPRPPPCPCADSRAWRLECDTDDENDVVIAVECQVQTAPYRDNLNKTRFSCPVTVSLAWLYSQAVGLAGLGGVCIRMRSWDTHSAAAGASSSSMHVYGMGAPAGPA